MAPPPLCLATPGAASTLATELAIDRPGLTATSEIPLLMARHLGLMKADVNYVGRISRFTAKAGKAAQPIFLTRSMLETLLYSHDGTHGLQFYLGFELLPAAAGRPLQADFRLLMAPAKSGADFGDTLTPDQTACHLVLPPYQVFGPTTPAAPYSWQPTTTAELQRLVSNQGTFLPPAQRPTSYFVGRYRLYNDVLQGFSMIRIEPYIAMAGGAVKRVGLVMAGVNSATTGWPAILSHSDTPGAANRPSIYWTSMGGETSGTYCTLPSPPRKPGNDEVL